MPEEIRTKCDLLIVNVGGTAYLVEAESGIANPGDMVDFSVRGEDPRTGWVEDVLTTTPYGELYCFISRLSTLCSPLAVYSKTWSSPVFSEEP